MSTAIPLPGGGYRLLTKGASEIVLGKCTSILKEGGNTSPLTPADHRQIVATVVKPMAGRALRTIALAYRCVCVCVGGGGGGGGGGGEEEGRGRYYVCMFGASLQRFPLFHGGLG